MSCERCGSFAINHAAHGRDGSEPSLCDVCYWRQRTEQCTASNATKDAEIASLREANRYLIDMHDAVIDDARKYTAAQAEIARLREAFTPLADALLRLLDATEGFAVDAYAKATVRTALARAGVEL